MENKGSLPLTPKTVPQVREMMAQPWVVKQETGRRCWALDVFVWEQTGKTGFAGGNEGKEIKGAPGRAEFCGCRGDGSGGS